MSDATDYDLMRFAQNNKLQTACYVGESWVHFRGLWCAGQSRRRGMVNRNPAAPLTIEDQLIFNELCENWLSLHRRRGLFSHCVESDQRDARRMFRMRECRDLITAKGFNSCIIAGLETALEGYDNPDQSLMEVGLACLLPKLPERYR